MTTKQLKILQEELNGVSAHIFNETLNYLRYLKSTKKDEIIGYSNGTALTPENYKKHIDASRKQYEMGDFISVEDLE